jgi:hypothetical protein
LVLMQPQCIGAWSRRGYGITLRREAAAIRKSYSGAGDLLFVLPRDKVKKQQIPRAKQLARGMTVFFVAGIVVVTDRMTDF